MITPYLSYVPLVAGIVIGLGLIAAVVSVLLESKKGYCKGENDE